jgi:hypothetical protein
MQNPIHDIIRILVVAAITAVLAACGDGGGGGGVVVAGGGGGVVGTGKQVVSGEVTGFGSVIVNGIEFTRSNAPGVSATPIELAFDNLFNAQETVLRPGMMVSLAGSYNTATNTGSYTHIVFSPELRGALDNGSVNAAAGTFSVFGRLVQTGASTVYDGVSDIQELQTRQNQGLELEVSGYLNSAGTVQASRIALKSTGFTNGKVQLKGQVSAVTAGSFTLGSLVVSTNGATFVGMTAADLTAVGLIVEVRGALVGTTVSTARIERKSATSNGVTGDSLDVKGVAVGAPVAGSFVLSNPDGPLQVSISGTSFFRGNTPADASIIVPGARLEVEGAVQADGSLAARKISVETEKNVRFEGNLTSVNSGAGSMTLNGVAVTTFAGTSYRDSSSSAMSPLGLADLVVGDHLQVYGFIDGTGKVIASQVERFNVSAVAILQGPVSSINVGTSQLTILGVIVSSQPGAVFFKGTTSFATFSSFAAQITPGITVVKAKGSYNGAGILATSLEIQP